MDELLKAVIIEINGEYHYYDKEGNELHEGDTIRYTTGTTEKLYLTNDNRLGIDATNRKWIETGRAVPCEYGVYPLGRSDMEEIVKIDAETLELIAFVNNLLLQDGDHRPMTVDDAIVNIANWKLDGVEVPANITPQAFCAEWNRRIFSIQTQIMYLLIIICQVTVTK